MKILLANLKKGIKNSNNYFEAVSQKNYPFYLFAKINHSECIFSLKKEMYNLLILLIPIVFAQCNFVKKEECYNIKAIYQTIDSMTISEKLNNPNFLFDKPSKQDIFTSVASSFLDTPYASGTLEVSDEEILIINTRGLDCLTFIETSLALTNSIITEDKSFEKFKNHLAKLRYRNGTINDYSSRIHYFTEWIFENEKNGIIENVTQELGGIQHSFEINFMSTHPAFYKQLKSNPELVKEISLIEERITDYKHFFITKERIKEIEDKLETGTIVGITTNISGLDFSHTGIIIRVKNRPHLLHASSDEEKVVISELPLYEYLMSNKKQTGVVVIKIK